jgi:hypothetical protein
MRPAAAIWPARLMRAVLLVLAAVGGMGANCCELGGSCGGDGGSGSGDLAVAPDLSMPDLTGVNPNCQADPRCVTMNFRLMDKYLQGQMGPFSKKCNEVGITYVNILVRNPAGTTATARIDCATPDAIYGSGQVMLPDATGPFDIWAEAPEKPTFVTEYNCDIAYMSTDRYNVTIYAEGCDRMECTTMCP